MKFFNLTIFLFLASILLSGYSASASQKYKIEGRPPSFAEEITLRKIEKFLASFETYQARFSQSNAGGGAISEGYFYIKRPGMARLDYISPTPISMVINDERVKYHDKRLDQVSYVDAGGHPFLPLLYKNKIISDKVSIQSLYEDEKQVIINFTALDDNQNSEKIFIRFLKDTYGNEIKSIRNIEREDELAAKTSIYLFDIKENLELDDEFFSLKNPRAFQNR